MPNRLIVSLSFDFSDHTRTNMPEVMANFSRSVREKWVTCRLLLRRRIKEKEENLGAFIPPRSSKCAHSHFLSPWQKMGHQPSKQQHHRQYRSASTPSTSQGQPAVPAAPISAAKYDLHQLAVITVVFNPVKYASRYEHYANFARHMESSGVQLYTVECIFPSTTRFGLPKQDYEIAQPNKPRHIRLAAPSILWMKENLINIVVNRLPANVEYIAWIDADIEFDVIDALTLLRRRETFFSRSVSLATWLASLDNCRT